MEKRISFRDFQSAKNVAKTIDPYLIQKDKYQAQINLLDETFNAKFKEKAEQLYKKVQEAQVKEKERLEELIQEVESTISLYEAGLVKEIGFHATDLVKKVIEPTGKMDANGKPIKVTKYLPTDIVSYDEEAKQYVITVPDETVEAAAEESQAETAQNTEADELPFGSPNENEEF